MLGASDQGTPAVLAQFCYAPIAFNVNVAVNRALNRGHLPNVDSTLLDYVPAKGDTTSATSGKYVRLCTNNHFNNLLNLLNSIPDFLKG